MKNKAVKIGIIASVLPHLFCCVLPIVLAVVGLFAPEFAHSSLIPEWLEPWLFVFSALMLGVSWVLILPDCPCSECDDEKSHKKQKIILSVITVLFIIGVSFIASILMSLKIRKIEPLILFKNLLMRLLAVSGFQQ